MDAQPYLPNAETLAAIEKDIANYNERRRHARDEVGRRIPALLGAYAAGCAFVLYLIVSNYGAFPERIAHLVVAVPAIGAVFGAIWVYNFAKRPGVDTQQGFRDHMLPVLFGFVEGLRYSRGHEPASFGRMPAPMKGSFNTKRFDDIVSGRLNGRRFEIYETFLSVKNKSSETVVFKGLVLNCPAAETFPGTLVAVRRPEPGLIDAIFRPLRDLFQRERLVGVVSRSVLDRSYEFSTDDTEAARPLLAGRFAEVLNWVDKTWGRGSPRLAIRRGELFVMLPSDKDFFELPPLERDVSYRAHLEPMVREFASLLAIVEEIQRAPQPAEPETGAGEQAAQAPSIDRPAEAPLPIQESPPAQEPIVPLLGDWEPPKKD